jgi:2-methylisocitrate lyase-like PEP mutase family enzyme
MDMAMSLHPAPKPLSLRLLQACQAAPLKMPPEILANAAVQAAKELPYPFTLTARAENLIHGVYDLKDTIKRLEAFADAGADVLFAPGLKTRAEIEAVVKAVAPRPVNVIMGIAGADLSLNILQEIGVKRVSVGSALIRAAYGAFIKGAEEIQKQGTFNFASDAKPYADLNKLFG